MDKLFLTILNMGLTGAFVITAICLVRLLLKKAPNIIIYCLWAVAGFRLIFPFSIESVFSLIPFKAKTIPTDITTQPVPHIESGITHLNNAVSSLLPAAAPGSSTNPLNIWITIGAYVWLIVAALMVIYGVASFIFLKRKLKDATPIEDNIFESRHIKSPFVLGVIRPCIYLTIGLSEKEKGYILLHEKTHIRRRDHLFKIVAYLILCLHWYNPLVWVAFLLMNADMEMSCDEYVLKEMGAEIKQDYSMTLLSLATESRIIGGSPLAFGEGGIKSRIKNILHFKKHSRILIITAASLATVICAGLAVNRIVNPKLIEMKIVYVENPAFAFKDMKLIRDDTVYHVIPDVKLMMEAKKGREIGYARDEYSTWRIYELKGYSRDYLLAVESEDVWRVMCANPYKKPAKQYILENATRRDKFERMMSVTLYDDGSAQLAIPPISSNMYPSCTYAFENDELIIFASIDSQEAEGAYGKKDGDVIARFTVADENTLVFKSGAIFADKGARYIAAPTDDEAISPELKLYPGVPADTEEAMPLDINKEGFYTLDYVITATVNYPWEADVMLYFSNMNPEENPIPVPFPYEENIDMHMLRIDIGDLFPKGYLGSVWAVVTDSKGVKHYSRTLNVVYSKPENGTSSEPGKWLDYYFDNKMPWDEKSTVLELPEYPGTAFEWTPYEVKAIDSKGEKTLINGMPVWNVYTADLTGDGLPEFCATVSIGSGIIDERIIVYDYSSEKTYELSDRMNYDYALYLDNGRLMVKQTKYPDPHSDPLATGELAIIDGKLTFINID